VADDYSDADGVKVLSYQQAQALARSRMVSRAHAAAGKTGPLTVASAVEAYIEYLHSQKKSGQEARYAADSFILPSLGDHEIERLTADQIRKWHIGMSKIGARIRTKPGEEQKYKPFDPADEEQVRQRKSTANRILTILKAALNQAWHDGKVSSDDAWRRTKPFQGVEAARVRYLSLDEATRLLNACEPDFRKLVRGALETGARYGELCALTVSDFNRDSGTVQVQRSKSNKGRHIILSKDGVAFFKSIAAGRKGSEPLFVKDDGSEWMRSHQADPMDGANKRAKIDPPINFHGLRHTWASHAVMNGVPLMIVARNLGHSDTRMVEKHYGHLAQSYVADAIRAGAPRFGAVKKTNVVEFGA
jgi:integrase